MAVRRTRGERAIGVPEVGHEGWEEAAIPSLAQLFRYQSLPDSWRWEITNPQKFLTTKGMLAQKRLIKIA
jgi:hypothetical protein